MQSSTLVHRHRDVMIKPLPTPRAHGTQAAKLAVGTAHVSLRRRRAGEPARHIAPIPSLTRPLCSVVVLLAVSYMCRSSHRFPSKEPSHLVSKVLH